MGFRAICIESRSKCSYSGGYLVVTKSDVTTRVHLSEISSLVFCTTQAYVSAYLLSELAKAKIPVVFCDDKYLPVAESLPMYGSHNNSARIAQQLEWTLPSKKRLWQRVVKDKIELQAQVLDLHERYDAADLLRTYESSVRSGDPDNREAVAAAAYFSALFGSDFRRDENTPLNASLDYGYSIVLSKVAREIVSKGYLTQIGIHHRGELNQWNLACDFMEPFRPYVDYVVMRADSNAFDAEMRRLLTGIMSRQVAYEDGSYRLGSVIGYYVRDCIDVLEKQRDPSDVKRYILQA